MKKKFFFHFNNDYQVFRGKKRDPLIFSKF